MDVIGLLETKPLLVCEQSTKAAVAKSHSFVCTQLLGFEGIFGRPVEAGAELVQPSRCILEIDANPLLRGIGASAGVVVIEVLDFVSVFLRSQRDVG